MNNNFELIYSPTKAKTKTRKAFTPRQKNKLLAMTKRALCSLAMMFILRIVFTEQLDFPRVFE